MIATAANMQFAMPELVQAFTAESGVTCETILGSSGKLTAQIREGAPFDILVSADMKYPEALYLDGLAAAPPLIYAYGRLILLTNRAGLQPNLAALSGSEVRHIALANPSTAPYGQAAREVLESLDLSDPVAEKLVYGESIAQTNQFITSGAAEIGFTALAIVRSNGVPPSSKWQLVDDALHAPIAQGAVALKNRPQAVERARQFLDFLQSERARTILLAYGYEVPED